MVPAARSLHSNQHMELVKEKEFLTGVLRCNVLGVQILKTEPRDDTLATLFVKGAKAK